jgi:hypothetical protein
LSGFAAELTPESNKGRKHFPTRIETDLIVTRETIYSIGMFIGGSELPFIQNGKIV